MQKGHQQLSSLQSSCPMSSENNFSRAKKTDELHKTQGADAWLQSRCSVPPAITAELLHTHHGGPFSPILLSHIAASYHGTAASMSLAPQSLSKHRVSKGLFHLHPPWP